MAETLTLQDLFATLETAIAEVKAAEQHAETVRRTNRAGITEAMATRTRAVKAAAEELAEAQRLHDAKVVSADQQQQSAVADFQAAITKAHEAYLRASEVAKPLIDELRTRTQELLHAE